MNLHMIVVENGNRYNILLLNCTAQGLRDIACVVFSLLMLNEFRETQTQHLARTKRVLLWQLGMR